jgi:hypothetical protein
MLSLRDTLLERKRGFARSWWSLDHHRNEIGPASRVKGEAVVAIEEIIQLVAEEVSMANRFRLITYPPPAFLRFSSLPYRIRRATELFLQLCAGKALLIVRQSLERRGSKVIVIP